LLNSIQRESFYSSGGHPAGQAGLANGRFPIQQHQLPSSIHCPTSSSEQSLLTNGSTPSAAADVNDSPTIQSIICWLRVEVRLEDWAKAVGIGQKLHESGFDQLQFMVIA
jgi:hypothetical protein